ncbi:MAG: flagellar secretion chaperone FliS [Blastocatellia bacterium]|nr:flagellar secretion chaperone FliS [Blastocatellia bacterium]
MYGRSNALASYGRVANSENDPMQQVVMLYDGAIRFLRLAGADIESGNLVAKADHTNRALDILNYLQSILDFEQGGEVASTLDRLYTLVSMKALRGSANLDARAMATAVDLLTPVRDSWNQIAAAAQVQPHIAITVPGSPERLGRVSV